MTLPRRRRPIGPERQATVNDAMVPGSFTGRTPSVAPVYGKKRLDARSRGITSTVNVTSRSSKIDQFTLAADGAQDLTLTYLPITDSENAIIRSLGMYLTDDYTLSGKTFHVVNGDKAPKTGDKVQVQYDYLTGVPATPTELESVSFGSSGWKYLQVATTDSTDRSGVTYDDSSWASGTGGFGNGYVGGATPFYSSTTAWTGSTYLWLRRHVTGSGTFTVNVRIDDDAILYCNGTSFATPHGANTSAAACDAGPYTVPSGLIVPGGPQVFAIRAVNTVDISYLDVQITQVP